MGYGMWSDAKILAYKVAARDTITPRTHQDKCGILGGSRSRANAHLELEAV